MTDPHPVIRPQPGVLEISPYVGGESGAPGANRVIKLSSNENPFGPSPKAKQAYIDAAEGLAVYPDGGHERLRQVIAEVHGLPVERLVCGAGSDELITLFIAAYAGPGDEVLFTEHGFSMYRIGAQAAGATPVAAPEKDRHTDVDALIAHMSERTKIVFVANPNNPTGTRIATSELARLADALPDGAMLALDGAYAEYVRDGGYDAGAALIAARENVVMTRTFSKIHGLAALRLGWMHAPDHVIDVMNRVRGPFNVSAPALAAGEAAMRDVDYVHHCAITNEVWRDWLTKEIRRMGAPVLESEANFILIDLPGRVEAADRHLKARGLITRKVGSYNLPDSLRITIGDEAACRQVAEAFERFLGAAR